MLPTELGLFFARCPGSLFTPLILAAAPHRGDLIGVQRGNRLLGFFVVGVIFLDPLPTRHGLIELSDLRQRLGASPVDIDVARIGGRVAGQSQIIELGVVAARSGHRLAHLDQGRDIPRVELQIFQPAFDCGRSIPLVEPFLQRRLGAHSLESREVTPLLVVAVFFLNRFDESPRIVQRTRIAGHALRKHLRRIVEVAPLRGLFPFVERLLQDLPLRSRNGLARNRLPFIVFVAFGFFRHDLADRVKVRRPCARICMPQSRHCCNSVV